MQISLQGQQETYWYFDKEIKRESLINQYSAQHCDLNWTDKTKKLEDKEYTVVLRKTQCFGLQFTTIFRLVTRLKHGSSRRG